MARNTRTPPSTPTPAFVLPEMILFRLDDDSTRILIARAAERKVGPGEFAGACVIEMMDQAATSASPLSINVLTGDLILPVTPACLWTFNR